MTNIAKEIFLLIRALFKISKLGISQEFKKTIRSDYIRTFFLKRYDHQNKVANFMGFKVKFWDYLAFWILFNDLYVCQEYHFVADNENPFIIDCGSNIGMSVIFFKKLYPESSVLAFEPSEEVFACLETNIKNNGLKSVVAHKMALTNKDGIIDFYYDQDDLGSLVKSIKQERMPKQKRSVQASTLSKYINREVDFLKMDVEGAELEIFEELKSERKLNFIKQMVIEYHHHLVKDSDVLSKMLQLLEDGGFGYQIVGGAERPYKREQFQDIMIYAYRKSSTV